MKTAPVHRQVRRSLNGITRSAQSLLAIAEPAGVPASIGQSGPEAGFKRLNRSASSLRRQLAQEGRTYREVLDDTRRSLAEDSLADGKHSPAQIACMLGVSDQSDFSRAIKRWTNMSPKAIRDSKKAD